MSKLSIVCIFIMSVQVAFCQKISFGKITKEELLEEKHTNEPEADAAVLYKKRRTFFDYNSEDGWVIVTKLHHRIKIYTKEGLSWANHKRFLRKSGNNEVQLSSIKGLTYNLVDDRIEKTKLKKEGIFREEYSKYQNRVSISFPNVKEGSIVDLEYTLSSPFWSIDDLSIQYSIPVNKVEAKIEIPEYFTFKKFQKGYTPVDFQISKETASLQVQWREKIGPARTESRNTKLDFTETVYSVDAESVPSLLAEAYVNNLDNYRTTFVFELAQYRAPDGQFTNYALSWEDVAKNIYEIDDFGRELKKDSYYKEDIKAVIEGVDDKSEKMVRIYDFVQKRMNWDDYYGVLCDKGVRKAYLEKTGNIPEINLMLVSMLRHAGLAANPVLVSTRSNGIPLYPTREGFNYIVAATEIDGRMILLDASVKSAPVGILPSRAINWQGRLIREDGSSTSVSLVPSKASKKVVSLEAKLEDNGDLSGVVKVQHTTNRALSFRESYGSLGNEAYLKELESELGNCEISGYDRPDFLSINKPATETYTIVKEGAAETIGDKLYFTPMTVFASTENPFKMTQRAYPIDFGYPIENVYLLNIEIPEGYQVESLPEGASIKLPDMLGMFRYSVQLNNNVLKLVCSFAIKTPLISPNYYETLKEFYKQRVMKETEMVVLSEKG